ncbi:MAG: FAD binding domain-containing protein [Candidatus Riflebacteria bacterium]|nr:FAD binding domain-containing protein [Candidatus Riflebacteria bacterium]
MLKKLTQFYHPTTIEEACKLLAKPKTAIIAGGTAEALKKDDSIEALVDITHIKELSHLDQDASTIKIGATTTVQEIYKSQKLKGMSGNFLKQVAGTVAATALRNTITAGGNLAAQLWWSDLPVAYLILDAEVVCRLGKPKRTVSVVQIINDTPAKFLKKGEIISEILVPCFGNNTGCDFRKQIKTHHDYPTITAATRITLKNGLISEARIACNAVTPFPFRCQEAEKMLVGKKPTAENIEKAAEKAANSIKYREDFRASKEYRQEVFQVMVRRSLEASVEAAKK